jgi:hypothetical protein
MKGFSATKAILWACAGLFAGYLVGWVLPDYLGTPQDPRSKERLSKVAAEINRSVPVMIDKETELLPVQGVDGMLIYNYRLVSYSAAQVDANKFAAGAKQRIAQAACSRPETRDDFLRKGVALRYSYFDKDKQHIATIDVKSSDCGF